jgi:hypothetical protein
MYEYNYDTQLMIESMSYVICSISQAPLGEFPSCRKEFESAPRIREIQDLHDFFEANDLAAPGGDVLLARK